jgi:hypothetical protein
MWWGDGWDHATPLARGVPCLVARRRFNSQLDGDESAKGFWVASYTSARQVAGPGSADTLTACLKRPGFRRPGFCGTDWDWRPLILIASRANHDGEVTPRDRKGTGAPPLSTGISTNAQDQSRDAAAPPCSRSPGMAQAASSNPKHRGSCHKPTGYRRLPGGNIRKR